MAAILIAVVLGFPFSRDAEPPSDLAAGVQSVSMEDVPTDPYSGQTMRMHESGNYQSQTWRNAGGPAMNVPSILSLVEWPLLAAFEAAWGWGLFRWLVWIPAGLSMLVGLFLMCTGIAGFSQRLLLVWQGSRAPGTVLEVADSQQTMSGEDGPLPIVFQVPRIQFTDDQGRTHMVSEPGNVRFSARRFRAGDTVTVIYRPEKPEECVLDRFADKWVLSLTLFAVGVVLILVGCIVGVTIVRS